MLTRIAAAAAVAAPKHKISAKNVKLETDLNCFSATKQLPRNENDPSTEIAPKKRRRRRRSFFFDWVGKKLRTQAEHDKYII